MVRVERSFFDFENASAAARHRHFGLCGISSEALASAVDSDSGRDPDARENRAGQCTPRQGLRLIRLVASTTVLLVVASCDYDGPDLNEVSEYIDSTTPNADGTVVVKMRTKGQDAGLYDMMTAGDTMFAVARETKSHPVSAIEFDIAIPVRDRYGNPGSAPAMTLTLAEDDLRKVNWPNFDKWGLLNLARVDAMTPYGMQLANAFCADDLSARASRLFCAQILYRGLPLP